MRELPTTGCDPLVPLDQVEAKTFELAREISANSPMVIALLKEELRVLSAAQPLVPETFEWIQGMRRAIYDSKDYQEGILEMSRAEDVEILGLARQRQAVVVTLDADFHAILAVSGAAGPSAIRLRLQGMNGPRVADLVAGVAGRFVEELRQGCLITVKLRKTTCHRLPISGA